MSITAIIEPSQPAAKRQRLQKGIERRGIPITAIVDPSQPVETRQTLQTNTERQAIPITAIIQPWKPINKRQGLPGNSGRWASIQFREERPPTPTEVLSIAERNLTRPEFIQPNTSREHGTTRPVDHDAPVDDNTPADTSKRKTKKGRVPKRIRAPVDRYTPADANTPGDIRKRGGKKSGVPKKTRAPMDNDTPLDDDVPVINDAHFVIVSATDDARLDIATVIGDAPENRESSMSSDAPRSFHYTHRS